jgi:ABC-2 type transport system permease protein
MTTTAPQRPATAAPRQEDGPSPFTGTVGLWRVFLRLDRVRTAVWVLALALTVWATVVSLEVAYPDAESRQARAALMTSPTAILMAGPAYGLEDYTFGAMVANEISLTMLVAISIMSILLAVRHTRAEEESGRMEVLRALPVGHFAPATAALLAVATANLVVGAAVAAALTASGLEVAGSVAFGTAMAVTGMVFGAVAAVTAQLTEHARAATGMALAALGVAFLVRGIGDIIENTGSWLSWLSPIAWAQQTRLYVDLRWWPLGLSVLVTVGLLAAAVALARRRDLGAGLRSAPPGPERAAPRLLTVEGLAHRLLRGSTLGWLVGLAVFGLAFGSLASSLRDMIEDLPQVGEWMAIDETALTESFGGIMLSFLALGAAAHAVSAALRLRAEDEAGRLSLLVVGGTSRLRMAAGWLLVVAVHSTVVLLVSGLSTGAGMAIATGEGRWVAELTVAGLAYLPAVLLAAAFAAALVGWAPSWAGLAWVLVVYMVFVTWFGEVLGMPSWSRQLSPVEATPLLPAEELSAAPLLLLAALTAALVAAALDGIRRRDLLA